MSGINIGMICSRKKAFNIEEKRSLKHFHESNAVHYNWNYGTAVWHSLCVV